MNDVLMATLGVQAGAAAAIGWALRQAVRDVQKVHRAGIGNGRRLYAHASVRREVLRLSEVAVFVMVTWLAAIQIDDVSPQVQLLLLLFLFAQIAIAANSLLDLRLWRQLRHEQGDRHV